MLGAFVAGTNSDLAIGQNRALVPRDVALTVVLHAGVLWLI